MLPLLEKENLSSPIVRPELTMRHRCELSKRYINNDCVRLLLPSLLLVALRATILLPKREKVTFLCSITDSYTTFVVVAQACEEAKDGDGRYKATRGVD